MKLLMKVHVKKVPKKRMTERKNMSGTYSQEWERTPMNLIRSMSNEKVQKGHIKFKKKSEALQFAVFEAKPIVVDVFSATSPQLAAPFLRVVFVVGPTLYCLQAVVVCPASGIGETMIGCLQGFAKLQRLQPINGG